MPGEKGCELNLSKNASNKLGHISIMQVLQSLLGQSEEVLKASCTLFKEWNCTNQHVCRW